MAIFQKEVHEYIAQQKQNYIDAAHAFQLPDAVIPAVAGAIANEYQAHFDRDIPGIDAAMDGYVNWWWDNHEGIKAEYDEHWPEIEHNHSDLTKLHQSIVNDMGPGNLKLGTAIEEMETLKASQTDSNSFFYQAANTPLVKDFLATLRLTSSELTLPEWELDYSLIAQALNDPDSPITPIIAALIIRDAHLYFLGQLPETRITQLGLTAIDPIEQGLVARYYTQSEKNALYLSFYKFGTEKFEELRQNRLEQSYFPGLSNDGGGNSHLDNEALLRASVEVVDPLYDVSNPWLKRIIPDSYYGISEIKQPFGSGHPYVELDYGQIKTYERPETARVYSPVQGDVIIRTHEVRIKSAKDFTLHVFRGCDEQWFEDNKGMLEIYSPIAFGQALTVMQAGIPVEYEIQMTQQTLGPDYIGIRLNPETYWNQGLDAAVQEIVGDLEGINRPEGPWREMHGYFQQGDSRGTAVASAIDIVRSLSEFRPQVLSSLWDPKNK